MAADSVTETTDEDVLVLPASFAQQRVWFLDQLTPGGSAYNVPLALRLAGALDIPALTAAMDEIVARHETLRTTFDAQRGKPVQVIVPERRIDLQRRDLSWSRPPRRDEALRQLLAAEAHHPFDLRTGPLLRCRLFRLGAEEHVLSLVFHHIIVDGWSIGVFLDELTALYDSCHRSEPSPLPELPIQYADYSEWQRAPERAELFQAQLEYWRGQLADAPQAPHLSTDRPYPRARELAGAVHRCDLSPELAAGVERLARAEKATAFMVLLAAVQVLLHRYSGQNDICVGTPVAGRGRPEVEPLIGFFTNTLVLRGDLSAPGSFRAFLGQVRQTCLGAYDHQDIPFEYIVDMVRPERSTNHAPPFQTMFVVQNAPGEDDVALAGLDVEVIEPDLSVAKFDLTIMSWGTATGGMAMSYEYSTDIFDDTSIVHLADSFAVLLAGIVADPDRPVDELPLLSDTERQRVLVDWNLAARSEPTAPAIPTPPASRGDRTLAGVVAEQVRRAPDAVAVRCGDALLTYGQLDDRANRLAQHLTDLGVRQETRVAICLDRSLDLVVAALAVLRAGGAYVPLDPQYPHGRLRFMLDDSGAATIITRTSLADRVAGPGVRVVDIDADAATIAAHPPRTPSVRIRPDNLAYIIYTSGSSGRPKGVGVAHAQVTRLMSATAADFGFGPSDVWTMFHSCAFDFSVWELWGCLAYGGTVVIVPTETSRSPRDFANLLATEGVTVLNQTPSALRELSSALFAPGMEAVVRRLALRWVILGGEALAPHDLRVWFDRLGEGCPHIVNMYGITETTVHTTCRRLEPADLDAGRSPIGRALADVRIYVLDRAMAPVPVGVAGELYVGGAGVARGYVAAAGPTAERFVPDPFTSGGARLYRTGDRGRWLAGGDLEYLGRVDDQVKMRGYRIEPGEIEAALAEHPQVRSSVVLLRQVSPDDHRLVAYIEPVEPVARFPAMTSELRAHLADRLPAHMIPASYLAVTTWPLTANGKLDRAALPMPGTSRPELTDTYTAPGTPTEQALAEVWGRLLNVNRIGRDDNFFDLGGHSFIALQVVDRIDRELGTRIGVATIFQAPTLTLLAAAIDHGQGTATGPLVSIRSGPATPALVLVHPVGGNILCYAELARTLNSGHPIYGLAAPGIDGEQQPVDGIEEMAGRYVDALLSAGLQPADIVLGGWSMGGVVAFEMARTLHARAGSHTPLFLIDSYAPGGADDLPLDDAATLALFSHDWAASFGVDLGVSAADLTGLSQEDALRKVWTRALASGIVTPDDDMAMLRVLIKVFRANTQALSVYSPPLDYGGDIVVLSATLDGPDDSDVGRGWQRWTSGRVANRPIPGDHYQMLRGNALGAVTTELLAVLAATDRRRVNGG